MGSPLQSRQRNGAHGRLFSGGDTVCGIAGLVALRERPLETAVVDAMTATLRHRGPDDDGRYLDPDGRAVLGFRRLSIIDLAGGHQPMSNEDGSVWLVFNGEIYNFEALRADLERAGHVFRTRADSETILHLYEECGDRCVERLRGMFAFAIWDRRRGRLLAARDRLGIKPLYWTIADDQLVFGSEVKALLQHPAARPDLDEEALYHYLTFLTTPAPGTLFRGVQKLPAGHTLALEPGQPPRLTRYWDAVVPTGASEDERDYVEATRALLADAVRSHMISDVPFGAFLSGGVDSSTNVALMSQHMSRPAETFSVGFAGHDRYNEFGPASRIADLFATNHHEVRVAEHEALAYLPEMVHHQDEPLADPVCVPLYFVSKLMRDSGVVVGHVGEGADEIFFGYSAYMRTLRLGQALAPWRRLPRVAFRAGAALSAAASSLTGRGGRLPGLLERAGAGQALFWGGAVAYDEAAKRAILSPGYRRRAAGLSSHDVVAAIRADLLRQKPEADLLEQMTYQDLKLRLPELLLMRVDKITMSTSVEARVPFLDHPLVEHALSIPSALKVRSGAKGILKQAVADLLPHDVIHRRKQGFAAPTAEWFRAGLGDHLGDLLGRSALAERGLFDHAAVAGLLDEHRRGRQDRSVHLWTIVNLTLWYEHWIAGRDSRALLEAPLRAAS
jgi:asparagine synthase (glutamine-hydrolysing)